MENKINIAEILRDMPKGTKLYSPLFGKCELVGVSADEYGNSLLVESFYQGVCVKKDCRVFSSDGRYFGWYKDSECLLFPSAKMRCWDKFFKRGDVLVDEDLETAVVFDGWANDDYTEFNTTIDYYKISDKWGKKDICCTLIHRKATDEERAEFIAAAEKHYGGKYNPETLQVEPVKVIEPKCSFKPFDKVLVRYGNGIWGATFFSRYDNKSAWAYVGVDCINWEQCIPYEGNEHLLGTDKSPE